MIKYMKDPFNKKETAYDYFKKKSGMDIMPDSDKKKLEKRIRKL